MDKGKGGHVDMWTNHVHIAVDKSWTRSYGGQMITFCPTCGQPRTPEDRALIRITNWLTTKLSQSDMTYRQLSSAINSRDRPLLQPAIAASIRAGSVAFDESTGILAAI
jgi:hypothetical protein